MTVGIALATFTRPFCAKRYDECIAMETKGELECGFFTYAVPSQNVQYLRREICQNILHGLHKAYDCLFGKVSMQLDLDHVVCV
ncbi:hypothetical protein ScPMuIL_012366 [Solemya velum]